MRRARLTWTVAAIVPLLLLLSTCEQGTQEASRCLHHYQGDFGNHTKWGSCPANWPPRPWEDAGR
jgi:hypothetical protein